MNQKEIQQTKKGNEKGTSFYDPKIKIYLNLKFSGNVLGLIIKHYHQTTIFI